MAATHMVSTVERFCKFIIELQGQSIDADFLVMRGPCFEVIIGHDILKKQCARIVLWCAVRPVETMLPITY